MSGANSSKAQEVFLVAGELPADELDAYLDTACAGDDALRAEVAELLRAAERADDYFGGLPRRLGIEKLRVGAEETRYRARAGQQFGKYRLTTHLGSGGTGQVWRAERSDGRFEGEVAIKIIDPVSTSSTMARINEEAQHLANLSHPNIARLLDAGVDDGHPYLVLEYVDGDPIDRYCDEQRLDVEARIRLFLDVLRAVAHAHAHLTVHRDIKPSNVLVDRDGTVKLLDFGIARLLQPDRYRAGAGQTIEIGAALTPEYAAPEQLLGRPVTTAADVYALGLMLYQLLVGRSARDVSSIDSFAELVEAATGDPPKASQVAMAAEQRRTSDLALRRTLRGDIDNILQMALATAPEDRYATATDFASDLRRYLVGEPVIAMPPTIRYRMRKFAKRHRGGVVSAALTALALIVAVVITTAQMIEARQQRDIAIYQQQRVQASNEFHSLLLEEVGSGGRSFTAVELLDRGAEMLEKQFDVEQPFIGRMHYDLSRRYSNMRETKRELELLRLAETAARANDDSDLLAATLCARARATMFSDLSGARELIVEGKRELAGLAEASIDSHVTCVRADANLADRDGDRLSAMLMLEELKRSLDNSRTAPTQLRGVTLNDLANMYYKESRYDESMAALDEILAMLDATGRGNTLGYLQVLANRSAVVGAVGEVSAELATRERLNARLEESNWRDDRASVGFRVMYGTTLIRLSRYEEGTAILERVRADAEALGSTDNVAMTDLSLASAYYKQDRLDDAKRKLDLAETALASRARAWEFQAARVRIMRANIARKEGRFDDARSRIGAELERHGYPPVSGNSPALATAVNAGALLELEAENYVDAERLANDYLQMKIAAARQPEQSADVGNALYLRARARIGQGQIAAAVDDLANAIVSLENGLGADNRETLEAVALLEAYQ